MHGCSAVVFCCQHNMSLGGLRIAQISLSFYMFSPLSVEEY